MQLHRFKSLRPLLAAIILFSGLAQAQLPSDPVFRVLVEPVSAESGVEVEIPVILTIDQGWHINSTDPGDDFAYPTELNWELPGGWEVVGLDVPEGEPLQFEFSEAPINVWSHEQILTATLKTAGEGQQLLRLVVTGQACNDSVCLPPTDVETMVEVSLGGAGAPSASGAASISAPAATSAAASLGDEAASDDDGSVAERLFETAKDKSLAIKLAVFFLFGLLSVFTPCVFPLVPITIGFFSAQSDKGFRPGVLAVLYVVGIAITYSVLGVTAVLGGKIFGVWLQHPAVALTIVAVMLALAASMFGFWDIQLPGFIMNLSGGRGGYLGALIMGLLIGIIAAPCVGPLVIVLIGYVVASGAGLFHGWLVFFTFSLGLGFPFLLLGLFTDWVSKLPMAGAWMVSVKQLFGVLILAVAAWFLIPVIGNDMAMSLLALTLAVGGAWLLVITRAGYEVPSVDRVMRAASALMIVAGVLMLQPAPAPAIATADGEEVWRVIEGSAGDLETAVNAGGPVIIDFYADWCVPCKELEHVTFADPRVAEILGTYTRFKVDMTRVSAAEEALSKEFKVLGMPTIVVLNASEEAFRVTGFEPPEAFLRRLGKVKS